MEQYARKRQTAIGVDEAEVEELLLETKVLGVELLSQFEHNCGHCFIGFAS